MPKISFCMPTRNRLEWIGESIQSLLTQTEEDIEIIIVNDASDDGTREFLDEWASQFNRIKIIHNETKQGGGISRNIAMSHATAPIIAICDDDDINPNERAALILEHFAKNPKSELVNFPYLSIDYFNGKLEEFNGEPFNHEEFIKTGRPNYFCNPSVAVKKASLEEVGGYEKETDKETDDNQFLHKWVKAGKRVDFQPDFFCNYHRILPKSMMSGIRGFDPKWVSK